MYKKTNKTFPFFIHDFAQNTFTGAKLNQLKSVSSSFTLCVEIFLFHGFQTRSLLLPQLSFLLYHQTFQGKHGHHFISSYKEYLFKPQFLLLPSSDPLLPLLWFGPHLPPGNSIKFQKFKAWTKREQALKKMINHTISEDCSLSMSGSVSHWSGSFWDERIQN